MKRLALRGDDAGSCLSANRAVAEACRFGLLKNASIMACGPAMEDAARQIAEIPGICIGLHITFNAEWDGPKWGPVLGAAVPSLVDENGYFLPTPHLLGEKGFSLDEAEAEAKAQLDRMRALGLPPDYLDEHMGVGSLPGLRDRLHALADREGLFTLGGDRLSRVPPLPNEDTTDPAATLIARLEVAPDDKTYLYVTHPGCDEEDMRAFYHARTGQKPGDVARERDTERRFLTDAAFATELSRLGVEVVRLDG
jgi:predicted glycoside hydrolase/deacetylase ChbG (UPF0249 family)